MRKSVTVKISASSHPDFELFGSLTDDSNGRQLKATRGNRAELDAWYDKLAESARKHGLPINLINE